MAHLIVARELSFALRALRRTPLLTTASIATIVLGVGPLTAIFTVLYGVVLRPLPYPHGDRLVQVTAIRTTTHQSAGFSLSELPDWEQGVRGLSAIAMYATNGFTTTGGESELVRGALVSTEFFALLRPAVLGRALDGSDATLPHAVVSRALWERRFGGGALAASQSITLDSVAYSIVGVTSGTFAFPAADIDVWIPIGFAKTTLPQQWQMRGYRSFSMIGLLAPGATVPQAAEGAADVARSLAQQYPRFNQDVSASVALLADTLSSQERPVLLMLFGAVACVWLIAGTNLANLSLVRSAGRVREMAIRRALGASEARIAAQFLAEAILLVAAGGGLALIGAAIMVRALLGAVPGGFARLNDVHLDAPAVTFSLALTALTTVVFAVVPGLRAARRDPAHALRGGRGTMPPSARTAQRALIVAEMALALMLLVTASLFTRSLSALLHVESGAQSAGVSTMKVNLSGAADAARQTVALSRVLERVASLPGVQSAGIISSLPPHVSQMRTSFSLQQPTGGVVDFSVQMIATAGDAVRTLGVPLLAGRAFRSSDTADSARVIVLSALAAERFFPGRDPIGQQLTFGRSATPAEIVGVVGDVRYAGLDAAVDGALYMPFSQQPFQAVYLVARSNGDPGGAGRMLRQAVADADPALAVSDVRPLAAVMSAAAAEPRLRTVLLGILAALAVVLAMVGLYGTTAHAITERVPEIGVRIALGARPADVIRLFLSQGLRVTAVGAAIGAIGVVLLRRLIASFLFGVTPGDAWSLAIAVLGLTLVGVAATWLPARRAAQVDPARTLRA